MFSFYKRRIQPIQQRHCLGFDYTGPADPSRMCVEELPDEVALQRVQRVLLDVDTVPYVPTLFSAQNPPKPVSIRLLCAEDICYCTVTELKNSLQGHTELYCSYPPRPDIPRPDHLLPSAAVAAKKAGLAAAQGSSESTECVGLQTREEAEGGPRRDNSSDQRGGVDRRSTTGAQGPTTGAQAQGARSRIRQVLTLLFGRVAKC
jgi:hypothetical protein